MATYSVTVSGTTFSVALSQVGPQGATGPEGTITSNTGATIGGDLTVDGDLLHGGTGPLVAPDGVNSYPTRAALVSAVSGGTTWTDGTLVSDGTVTYVASADATAISDLGGLLPFGEADARHFGMVGDGSTDNGTKLATLRTYCTATGDFIYFNDGGTYLCDRVNIGLNQVLKISGKADSKATIRLNAGENIHVIETINDSAVLVLKNIIIDQNEANQTAGHGVRSGGAAVFDIENTDIINTFSYGIGIQEGTTAKIRLVDLYFENIGDDAIDIKDFDLANGVAYIRNIRAKDWGLKSTDKPILDLRGPGDVKGIHGIADNNCVGLRLRDSGPQGRAGSGVFSQIYVVGNGTDTVKAVNIETSEGNFVISDVYVEGCDLSLTQEDGAAGGMVCNLVSRASFGDGVSIAGANLVVNGADVECTASSTRAFDIESTAENAALVNFNATNLNTAQTQVGRIVSGAVNTKISGDMRISHVDTIGGTNGIADAGTGSDLGGLRSFLI